MRYQDWDVLVFPDLSKIPLQEFKTTCQVIQDTGKTLSALHCHIDQADQMHRKSQLAKQSILASYGNFFHTWFASWHCFPYLYPFLAESRDQSIHPKFE
jgi:hypothetical protein